LRFAASLRLKYFRELTEGSVSVMLVSYERRESLQKANKKREEKKNPTNPIRSELADSLD